MSEYTILTGQTILIDAQDLKWIKKYNWSLMNESIRRREGSRSIVLSQEILNRMGKKGIVKFKNLNKLDYQRKNLDVRERTKYVKKNKVSSSGHKYIYKVKTGFQVSDPKTTKYLGYTKTIKEALLLQKIANLEN